MMTLGKKALSLMGTWKLLGNKLVNKSTYKSLINLYITQFEHLNMCTLYKVGMIIPIVFYYSYNQN
jgi:hypothetical protein